VLSWRTVERPGSVVCVRRSGKGTHCLWPGRPVARHVERFYFVEPIGSLAKR
jgi:hypothetical protein